MRTFLPICLTLAALAAPAHARQTPVPKPSGIVVHLFGPGSITSNILPTFAGSPASGPAVPAPAPPGSATGNAASARVTKTTAPGASQTPDGTSIEPADTSGPTLGDVLHQMFVVGDPNRKSGPAPGRTAEYPKAVRND